MKLRAVCTPVASRSRVWLILGSLLIYAGCGRVSTPSPVSGPIAKNETIAKTYTLTGIVRHVDREAGVVTIRHDEVPGYMPKMTMPFHVVDKALLDDVRPDDKVKGALRVDGDRADLVDLTVTEAAQPAELTLDTSGGSPTLRVKKKVLEPGELVPDFAMTTQEGRPLRLSDLRGKVVVLTFIYTRCPQPNFCPLMDKKFASLSRLIQAVPARNDKVRLLSVSFDPEHDTPEVLRRHAAIQGAKPPVWEFAVASHDELRKVIEPLGLMYGPTANEIVHSLSTAIIDGDGKLVRLATGGSWTPEDFLSDIQRTLRNRP